MAMADLVAVTCLRHGLTSENKKGAYIGWTNASLSDEGKKVLCKQKPEMPEADAVISSDLLRCRETVDILYPTVPVTYDESFRELHFGGWEGKTYEQLKGERRYREWLNDPEAISPPEGEGIPAFSLRLNEGWRRCMKIFADPDVSHIVIVTHGGPIKWLITSFGDPNMLSSDHYLHTEPGCGWTLYGDRKAIEEGGRCISLQAVPLMAKRSG